jgi:hypothetical protein
MTELAISAGHVVQVDEEDLPELSRHRWTYVPRSCGHGAYAARWITQEDGRRKTLYMHRQLMGEPPEEVDHEDGDGLNNQRHNLRCASRSQNSVNRNHTNTYRGVYPFRMGWKSQAKVNGKNVHIGVFKDPVIAARAYDVFVLATWGPFARINGV